MSKTIDRNIINKAIATPIKGVISHLGATLSYFKFNGFNKSPTKLCLGLNLELSLIICVIINIIFYSFRFVDFVYHFTINIRIFSHRSIMILKL